MRRTRTRLRPGVYPTMQDTMRRTKPVLLDNTSCRQWLVVDRRGVSEDWLVTLDYDLAGAEVVGRGSFGSVVKVRTCTRQRTHDIEVSIPDGVKQWRVALPVNSVQISPRAAENLHDGAICVLHRSMERCVVQGSVAQYRKACTRSI